MDHEAIFKAYPDVVSIGDNSGAFDKDGKKITLVQSKIDEARAELAKLDYKWKRAVEYPTIGDQLDDLYKKGAFSDEMTAKIKAVKDKYPKS